MTQIPPASTPPESGQAAVIPGVVETDKEARKWGMFAHLAALSMFIAPAGLFLGPLCIWLIKRDQFAFVDRQGKEALNWQLTMLIGYLISLPLMAICIGGLTFVGLLVLNVICVVKASMRANEGIEYKYPWKISFVK